MGRTTHGMRGDATYTCLRNINARCLNDNKENYSYYGGRGITVCDRWNLNTPNAFENFLSDMGMRPSSKHSIDRIDNDGPYSPENCRWATLEEQGSNRRDNHMLTHCGDTQTLAKWSRQLNIPQETIRSRIYKYGWTDAQALGFDPVPYRYNNPKILTYEGVAKTFGQWGTELGIRTATIKARISRGWTTAQALGFDPRK